MPESFARRRRLRELTALTQEVARELSPDLDVLGVVGADPGSHYVEILLGITDCSVEPCRFAVGVDGGLSSQQLRDEIRERLREHCARLLQSPPARCNPTRRSA